MVVSTKELGLAVKPVARALRAASDGSRGLETRHRRPFAAENVTLPQSMRLIIDMIPGTKAGYHAFQANFFVAVSLKMKNLTSTAPAIT